MEEGWTTLCQALRRSMREEEWTYLHKPLKEVSKNMMVKKAASESGLFTTAGLETVAERMFLFRKGRASASFPQKIGVCVNVGGG